ncbi:MAG: sulfotransferase [Phycisphaerae bacterium]
MRKPNFFIIGAPKCGTTALHHYLSEHPRVFMSQPKEAGFLCADIPGKSKLWKLSRNVCFRIPSRDRVYETSELVLGIKLAELQDWGQAYASTQVSAEGASVPSQGCLQFDEKGSAASFKKSRSKDLLGSTKGKIPQTLEQLRMAATVVRVG